MFFISEFKNWRSHSATSMQEPLVPYQVPALLVPSAMDSPSTVETQHNKGALHVLKCESREFIGFFFLNRSESQSSAVDGPPSTRRKFLSPSDATHNVESQSTKDTRQLEAQVATIALSKYDLNEKATETLRETAQRAEFAKLLNTRSGGMYILPARLRTMQLWINGVWNINDFLGMPFTSLSRVSSIGWTLPILSRSYQSSFLRTSFVGGICLRGALWRLRLPVSVYPCFCCACGYH